MAYKVKTDVFEGPFDLLVYLIENAEMSVYDIKVAEITEQYIAYVEKMQETNVEIATEFMVLAAALLEIKSKMLLHRPAYFEGTEEYEDPRSELVEKLLEYKKFKLAAENLGRLEDEKMLSFDKPKEDLSQYTGGVDEYLKLDVKEFVSAFSLFLRKKQRLEEVKKRYTRLEKQRQSVEMKVAKIFDFFRKKLFRKVDFSELIDDKKDRYDVVLTFTSMLQMMREHLMDAEQEYNFGEISLEMSEKGLKKAGEEYEY